MEVHLVCWRNDNNEPSRPWPDRCDAFEAGDGGTDLFAARCRRPVSTYGSLLLRPELCESHCDRQETATVVANVVAAIERSG